jgi:hypothetical protein
MKLMQRRVLVLMDDEGRQELGEIQEGDSIQFIDAKGRYKYGDIKRINSKGLILNTDGEEWHMPIKYIDYIMRK